MFYRELNENPYRSAFLFYDEFILKNNSHHLMGRQNDATLQQNRKQLNCFLTQIERRALRLAQLATGNTDHALDIVQDAMLLLSRKYGHKPEQEWGALFHRILQNKIKDWYRSQSVRHRIFDWFGIHLHNENAEHDPIQSAEDKQGSTPAQLLDNEELGDTITAAIKKLPHRQQQAFLLRNWEGLSVRQTAQAMQCSEGSVKTHCSRAIQFLKQQLEGYQL